MLVTVLLSKDRVTVRGVDQREDRGVGYQSIDLLNKTVAPSVPVSCPLGPRLVEVPRATPREVRKVLFLMFKNEKTQERFCFTVYVRVDPVRIMWTG